MGEGEKPLIQDGFPQQSFLDDHHHHSADAGDIQHLTVASFLRRSESAKKINTLAICIKNITFN